MSQPLRVLFSANTAWYLYNFRRNTIRKLLDRGIEVVVAAPQDPYLPRLQELGCNTYALRMPPSRITPLADLRLLLDYLKVHRRYRPHLCFHFTIKANVYATFAAALMRVPAVNNVCGLGPLFARRDFIARIGQWLYRSAIRLSVHSFFQSRADLDVLTGRYPALARKISLIPGSGVDLTLFQPEDVQTSQRHRPFVFAFIGRLLQEKGVLEFLQAAERLNQRGADCDFLVIGEPPANHDGAVSELELAPYRQVANIRFLGHRDDVAYLLKTIGCVVLPTRYNEGIPRVLLEAAASGVPVIASAHPGCRQVVKEYISGLICADDSADTLEAAMRTLLAMSPEERRAMGERGREIAERSFSESLAIAPYLDIAGQVRDRPRVRPVFPVRATAED